MKRNRTYTMQSQLFIFLVILGLYSCSKIEISDNEKQLLISEKAFTDFGYIFPDAPQGKYTKFKLPDGAVEIMYAYKGYSIDSSYLHISNTITIDRNKSDAEETYLTKAESLNFSKVVNAELITLEGFSTGEESILYLWLMDDEPAGNYFQFRNKNMTYQLILQGFYFSDVENWTLFFNATILPTLDKIFL